MITVIIGRESLLTKHLKIYNKKSKVFSSRSNEIDAIIKSSHLKIN